MINNFCDNKSIAYKIDQKFNKLFCQVIYSFTGTGFDVHKLLDS